MFKKYGLRVRLCIVYIFLIFFILWYFCHLKNLSGWRERPNSELAHSFPETKSSASQQKLAFEMQTNQWGAGPSQSGTYPQEAVCLCLNHPKASYQSSKDPQYNSEPKENIETGLS